LGAYLTFLFLGNKFYLRVRPTWVITEDGYQVKGGPDVGRLIAKWTGPERNLHVLYHVRFWTAVLRRGRGGPISVRAGDQSIEISTIPAFIELPYGIAGDQKDLLRLLDQEAELIAAAEDEAADQAVEVGLEIPEEMAEEEKFSNEEEGKKREEQED
jgi:hypothetical protein